VTVVLSSVKVLLPKISVPLSLYKVSAEEVKTLREETGDPVMEVRRALMESRPDQPAHSRDEAGVLNLSRLVNQLRRDRANLRILEGLDQILNPVGLHALDIVIEKDEARAGGS
jgi:hypothetical protein